MPIFLLAPNSPHHARTRCPGPCSPVPAGAVAGIQGLAAMAPAHRDASSGDPPGSVRSALCLTRSS